MTQLVEELRATREAGKSTWFKVISAVGGAFLIIAAMHQTFIMPTIREETRVIVNTRVESLRHEREKDTSREYTALKDRLDRIEGKLDRVIESK